MEGSVSLKKNLAEYGEIEQYARDLQAFRNLEIDAERFTAIRLQMFAPHLTPEMVDRARLAKGENYEL